MYPNDTNYSTWKNIHIILVGVDSADKNCVILCIVGTEVTCPFRQYFYML